MTACQSPDGLDVMFDDELAVANAGLILPATLAAISGRSSREPAGEPGGSGDPVRSARRAAGAVVENHPVEKAIDWLRR